MSQDAKFRAHFAALQGGQPATTSHRRPKQPIDKTYCILITPRSGSTWLSRRIARLDMLSCPEEHFIAEEFSNTLKFNPGRDIYEVFDVIAAKNRTKDGVFGFEMSYFDLEEFEQEARLLDVMPGEQHFFYLNRRNFVAQAVSLHLAVESQVFHAFCEHQERPEVPYHDESILHWACHILQQEYGIQRWLRANRVHAMRLCYEELVEDIDRAIGRIADRLRMDLSDAGANPIQQTEKINAGPAADYEHEFRDRHWDFCRKWEAVRGTAPCPYSAAVAEAVAER